MLVSTGRSLSIWKFRNDDLIFFGASFIILYCLENSLRLGSYLTYPKIDRYLCSIYLATYV